MWYITFHNTGGRTWRIYTRNRFRKRCFLWHDRKPFEKIFVHNFFNGIFEAQRKKFLARSMLKWWLKTKFSSQYSWTCLVEVSKHGSRIQKFELCEPRIFLIPRWVYFGCEAEFDYFTSKKPHHGRKDFNAEFIWAPLNSWLPDYDKSSKVEILSKKTVTCDKFCFKARTHRQIIGYIQCNVFISSGLSIVFLFWGCKISDSNFK